MKRVTATLAICTALIAQVPDATAQQQPAPPGDIVGRIELAPNVGLGDCLIVVSGTPVGARCEANGNFTIRRTPPGTWDITVTSPGLPPVTRRVASASGIPANIGVWQPWPTGNITGRVQAENPALLGGVLVELPLQGLAAKPAADGTFILTGVAPGHRELVVTTDKKSVHTKVPVDVKSGQTARVNVQLSDALIKELLTTITPPSGAGSNFGKKVEPKPPIVRQ